MLAGGKYASTRLNRTLNPYLPPALWRKSGSTRRAPQSARVETTRFHAEITQYLRIIHPNVMVRNDDVR